MPEPQDRPRFDVREMPCTEPNMTILKLSGQLDAHTAPEFERFLEDRVRTEQKHRLILDFSTLDYISSAGLGVLMVLIEEVRAENGDMKLAALPEKIYHVLDLLGFPMVFQIYPSVEEASNAFA